MKLEFDFGRGYGGIEFDGRSIDKNQYMQLPVIKWLDANIGLMKWPKAEGEAPNGQGWRVLAEWATEDLTAQPRVYIIFTTPLAQRQITEFWMRFA